MSEELPPKKLRFGHGLALGLLFSLALAVALLSHFGFGERLRERIWKQGPVVEAADFPAGVASPAYERASMVLRPTYLGTTLRGYAAPLLWAAGEEGGEEGLWRESFAIEVRTRVFANGTELSKALALGGDNGGVDMAVLSLPTLLLDAPGLKPAVPRVLMLMGWSRGQDILVATQGLHHPGQLRNKRVAVEMWSPGHHLLLWTLSRVGLRLGEIELLELPSALDAGAFLEKGVADAAAGLYGELLPWVLQNKGEFLDSTADVPHLVASVLVARGSFVARYPEVILRVIRGLFDLEQNMARYRKRMLKSFKQQYPNLGKPEQMLQEEPLASMEENLAFFGLRGQAAVGYAELYQSTTALASKLYERPPAPRVEESLELAPLKRLAKLQ
ncbi:MAG: hypothetical protein FWD46_05305 [Cystobacterineae bacterium]|nr:hypothetical protein [Cystobacterineae bacterium]